MVRVIVKITVFKTKNKYFMMYLNKQSKWTQVKIIVDIGFQEEDGINRCSELVLRDREKGYQDMGTSFWTDRQDKLSSYIREASAQLASH